MATHRQKKKESSYLDYWPIGISLILFFGLIFYIAYDSVSPRTDDWCRGLRQGHYAGNRDRRQYLSKEPSIKVGYEREHLDATDRYYSERLQYIEGYSRGYKQAYAHDSFAITAHLEDTSRCNPNYMYLGFKRGYSF
jgi:hypothetical protein